MNYIVRVYIKEAENSDEDIATLLEEVAVEVREGNISGSRYNLSWEIEEDE